MKVKQEYYTELITEMLQKQLKLVQESAKDIEGILSANLCDIDTKAILIFEVIQGIQFNSQIFRELQEMKRIKEG